MAKTGNDLQIQHGLVAAGWGALCILHCIRGSWTFSHRLRMRSILCCKKREHQKSASERCGEESTLRVVCALHTALDLSGGFLESLWHFCYPTRLIRCRHNLIRAMILARLWRHPHGSSQVTSNHLTITLLCQVCFFSNVLTGFDRCKPQSGLSASIGFFCIFFLLYQLVLCSVLENLFRSTIKRKHRILMAPSQKMKRKPLPSFAPSGVGDWKVEKNGMELQRELNTHHRSYCQYVK